MSKDNSSTDGITRRAVVATAAAAGTLAIAAPADAQRLPAPPRTKGPRVWLDMDQQDLDEAYDQRVYAFNQENIAERRNWNSEKVREVLGEPAVFAYGTPEIEKIEVYKTNRPNAPVNVYIHGGAWRGGRARQNAYMAETFVKAGAHFAPVDFYNVGETNGDLFPMVEQCRRAVAWVYKNAASFGGDRERIYLCGHSSGAHIGGCLLITDWSSYGVPQNVIKAALLGSGMYDLKAVRLSQRSSYVKFTDRMEHELSTQRHLERIRTPLTLTHGSLETPEFQRQTREFHAALVAAGKPAKLIVGKGYNHYETQETMGNPYGFMGRAALEMMKLA